VRSEIGVGGGCGSGAVLHYVAFDGSGSGMVLAVGFLNLPCLCISARAMSMFVSDGAGAGADFVPEVIGITGTGLLS
jgi:hypothetical protein